MKKKLSILLLLIGGLGFCYIIATLILNHFLSEERLRVMLIEPAEEQLGLKVDIGSIDVSLFSGINIGNITVHGKNGGEDFLTVDDFRLSFRLLPLLRKRLVITKFLLDRPALHLSRNNKGDFNFADLSLTPKKIEKENLPPEELPIEPLPLSLIFDKIVIEDANLTFIDRTGELPEIIGTEGDLNLSLVLADKLAESRYQGTLELIVNASYPGHKPVLIVNCDFNQDQASFKGDLNVEFEKMIYNGRLLNPLTRPELTLNIQSASLDLAKLAYPDHEAKNAAPASEKSDPEPSSMKAPATDSASPAGDLPATPPSSSTIPKDFIVHGQITVGNILYDKLALQKLNLDYEFKDRLLVLGNINFETFGGQVTGQLQADLSRNAPDFQGEIKASKLLMAKAMASLDKPEEYLSGDLSADLSFRGSGKSWPAIRKTLDGEGRFSLADGGLSDSPYSRALANILEIPELNELKFDELAGTMTISEGRIALLCTLSSSALDLQSKGNVGLDGSLDLPLTTHLSKDNSQRLLERSKYTGYLADESGRITLNLKLTGTVEQPQLTLDRSGTEQQVKKVLEKKAGEELGRALTKQLGGTESGQKKEVMEDLSNRFLKQMLDK